MKSKHFNDKKIKIAMLGHKRVPSREGGVEIVVEELSVRMAAMGHRVTCYNRRGQHIAGSKFNSKIKDKYYKGVRIKRVFTLNIKGISAFLSSIFSTITAIFDKPDVMHYHAEGSCGMLWLPHLLKIKTVVTVHGLDWQRAKWSGGFGERYILFCEKTAVRYADEIIVLSENVKRYFKDTYGRKTHFIPNGVNKPEKREPSVIKERWNLEKDEYILFLGRLVPEKGVHYLIEAYSGLETDKKLVIAGSASDTDGYLERLRDMSVGNENIIFTGFADGDLYSELLSNAYIYVLPSDLEGMPLSLLEAMSFGNCSLVSDIPECSDVVEDKGVTFKKSDAADLKEKLCMLLNDADKVSFYKNNSAKFILSKYNWDDIVSQTLEIYKGCI